ncbi:MAG TPA: DUF3168 domain-containing protein [Longimicrobiales bacterium]|jgi:predicted unusual protein kinase regulating ubiquinone biosynthesis (AarF/ABC1/UbiB family)
MYAADAVQAAIYAALDGQIPGAVYDHVPPGTAMPYTVIGELTEVPADTHDRDGAELTATLHVWSAATGTREVNEILAAIDARLHHVQLPAAAGVRIVHTEREMTEIMRDEDITTGRPLRHAVVRYRLSVEEAP